MKKLSRRQRKLQRRGIVEIKDPYIKKTNMKARREGTMRLTIEEGENSPAESVITSNTSFRAKGRDRSFSRVVFKAKAFQRLKKEIDWGKMTIKNVVELTGALYGSIYKTPNGVLGIVEDIYLSEGMDCAYIDPRYQHWYSVAKRLDAMNEKRKKDPLFQLGWWKTQPEMCVVDRKKGKEAQVYPFEYGWQFTILLDPQNKTVAAYIGEDMKRCDVDFTKKKKLRPKDIIKICQSVARRRLSER